jgi:hypothetical protein
LCSRSFALFLKLKIAWHCSQKSSPFQPTILFPDPALFRLPLWWLAFVLDLPISPTVAANRECFPTTVRTQARMVREYIRLYSELVILYLTVTIVRACFYLTHETIFACPYSFVPSIKSGISTIKLKNSMLQAATHKDMTICYP